MLPVFICSVNDGVSTVSCMSRKDKKWFFWISKEGSFLYGAALRKIHDVCMVVKAAFKMK